MKKVLIALLAIIGIAAIGYAGYNATAPKREATQDNALTIYAYDSLTADWGLLPDVVANFEQQYGAKITLVDFSDTGTILATAVQEKDAPKADIIMGLDNVNFPQVKKEGIFEPYTPMRADGIKAIYRFDDDFTMTPFDYGYIAFVYDSEAISFDEPITLADLASETYKGKVIIEQPGLSSPGTQLLLWSHAAMNDAEATTFWNNMKNTVLTVAPDWNTAYYGQFMEGEAPIVLSYITSPAYHMDQEATGRYKAIPMQDGYIRQVEGIGVVNGTRNRQLSRAFIDYVLADEVQNRIPTTQWVFPLFGDDDSFPEAYNQIITPSADEVLTVDDTTLSNKYNSWLTEWSAIFDVN